MISVDCERILVSKNVVCSYCCESLWVDNKCSKHFKSYLGKHAIYNFY